MNKKISFPIAITIIIVCAVSVVGLAAWQYLRIPEKGEEVLEGAPEDETADWKTYRNEEYGFEIDYPTDGWSFEDSSGGFFTLCKAQNKDQIDEKACKEACIFMTLEPMYSKCYDLAFKDIIKENDCFMHYAWNIIFEEEIITDSGVVATKGKGLFGTDQIVAAFFFVPDILLPPNDMRPVLFLHYYLSVWDSREIYPFAEKKEKILNQMISTFKFVD